jgi:hypothetical protein
MNRTVLAVVVLPVVAACQGGSAGGKTTDSGSEPWNGATGAASVACEAVATTPLGPDDESPLGFTPADFQDFTLGDHALRLTWAAGGDVHLTLSVAAAGDASFVDYEVATTGTGPVAAIGCADDVELPATVDFATDDGSFDERWDVVVTSLTGADAAFYHQLDLASLGGTYTVTEVDPTLYDAVRVFVDGRFDANGPFGTVSGQAEDDGDPSDPSGVASATLFDVAAW